MSGEEERDQGQVLKGHVLVVDDHVEMGRMLAEPLQDAGYSVELATSGADAVARVRARPFDAVLSDLRMEQVDGFDVLAAVHAVDAETPLSLIHI